MQRPPWHSVQRKIAARAAKFRRHGSDLDTKADLRALTAGIRAADPSTKVASEGQPCSKCGKTPRRFKWCSIPYCTNKPVRCDPPTARPPSAV